ncbi:MAG: hypothetical protein ACXW04_01140 [Methylobacter sp.]
MKEKRLQWELIKQQAPDVADWLGDISKTFGKPAAMVVELASGEVIESGEFQCQRSVLNCNKRG